MVTTYQTRDGDTLDLVCFDHYGKEAVNQSVVAVLEANPGLADYGPVLPAGIAIILPVWSAQSQTTSEALWE